MALFFELCPVTARYQGGVRRGIRRALGALPHEIVREYRASLQRHTKPESRQKTYTSWILENHMTFAGFLQSLIVLDGRETHRQGAEIRPWDGDLYRPEEGLPKGLTAINHTERVEERTLHFLGIVPADLEPSARIVLDAEILPFLRAYFLNLPALQDERTVDLVQELENHLRRFCQPHLESQLPVTFIHFQFQDMAIYFEMSGEHRSLEILEEVNEIIVAHLKSGDELIQLAPGSVLVVAPGARAAQMRERFRGVYFQTRSLILDCKSEVLTLESPPIRFAELWRLLGV